MEHKLNPRHNYELRKLIQEGSYEMCCKFLEDINLHPIQGVYALKYLINCVQSLKEEYSAEFLVKFVNYLNISEDVMLGDFKNYLLAVCHIVQFLTKKDEWRHIHGIMHLIKPFHKGANENEQKLYQNIRQSLLYHLYKTTQDVTSDTITEFMYWIINFELMYNPDGLMTALVQLMSSFSKKNFCTQMVVVAVDALIQCQFETFANANFIILLNIIRNAFQSNLSKSKNAELVQMIRKLKAYTMSSMVTKGYRKQSGLHEVMEYFESTTELYLTLDLLDLGDPSLFVEPINKINQACGNSSALIYLQKVVACSIKMQAEVKIADCQLIDKIAPITYTKDLHKSLRSYISHSKSQAIILKDTELLQKCCCPIKTNVANAIISQIDAFVYIVHLLKLVKDESSINPEIYMALHKVVINCMEWLKTLKLAGCKKVPSIWETFSSHLYNYCWRLTVAKRKNVNIVVLETLVSGCFRYSDNFLICNVKCTEGIFYYLADCLVAFKRWSDAQDICALSIRMHKNSSKPITNIWNTVMYNYKGNETVADVLARKSDYLQSICGDAEILEEQEMAELYMCEVRNYVQSYKKWSLVQKSLDLLVDHVNASEYISFLTTLPFDVIHYCSFKVFINKHGAPESALNSGIFKFLLYKRHLRVARKAFKALPQIGKTEPITSEEDDMESNDVENQHASNYCNIGIKVHNSFIVYLKESLSDLSTLRDTNEECSEMVLDMIIEIGHEFELHCYETNARATWTLAIQIANKMKAFDKLVHAATFLLKYIEEKQPHIILTCRKLMDAKIEMEIYTKFTFYTELAMFYLRTNQLKAFREAYHIANSMFYECGGSLYKSDKSERSIDRDLTTAHFALMIGAMEMLPCREVVDEMHGSNTFHVPRNAWTLLLSRMHSTCCPKQTRLHVAFFDLGEHIVWKYYWSRMARDAKQCAMTLANFAMNTISTFRVCRQLVFLGKLRIQELQVEACQGIINDLDVILKDCTRSSTEEDVLSAQLDKGLFIRDTSPVTLKQFRAPNFLKHEDCSCTPCISKDYQCAIIEKYHLESIVADHYNDHKTTVKLLEGCFNIYQNCKKRCGLHSVETYAGLLWTSTNICRRLGDTDNLRTNITSLSSLFKIYHYKNFYLYNEVNTLQLKLLVESIQKRTKISASKEVGEKAICKTPECPNQNDHSPRTPKSMVVHNQTSKASTGTLEVPMPIGARSRVRGKRNLMAELEDTKLSDEQTPAVTTTRSKTKVTVTINKKATRSNTRKAMR